VDVQVDLEIQGGSVIAVRLEGALQEAAIGVTIVGARARATPARGGGAMRRTSAVVDWASVRLLLVGDRP
jgi:hypothetical protein